MPSISKNRLASTVTAIQTRQGVNQSLFFSNELNDARQRYAKTNKRTVETVPGSLGNDSVNKELIPISFWQSLDRNFSFEPAVDHLLGNQGPLVRCLQASVNMGDKKTAGKHEKYLKALLKKCLAMALSKDTEALASDSIRIDFMNQPDNTFSLSAAGGSYRLQVISSDPDFIRTAIEHKKGIEQQFQQQLLANIVVDVQAVKFVAP